MHICVFCSAQEVAPEYRGAARELGVLIGQGGHALVWGGSDRGLMHEVAHSAHESGAKLVGISMDLLKHKAHMQADEMLFEKDLAARKATMLKRSDAFVALAGGIGTLDEITEILALKRHGLHDMPVVFLNTGDFFEGMRTQLARMQKEGFLAALDADVVAGLNVAYFAETPADAMRYIESYGN